MRISFYQVVFILSLFFQLNSSVFGFDRFQAISSFDSIPKYSEFFESHPDYFANDFQFPVGPPDAKGYYNAQFFGVNLHLGEDWNGVGGGNTDMGDPVYSVANGYVSKVYDYKGGWGKVIHIIHYMPNEEVKWIESVYAHLNDFKVKKGDAVKIGQEIASIGNADGQYLAHLHFEMRDQLDLGIGGGYGDKTEGYIDPTKFIKNYRK